MRQQIQLRNAFCSITFLVIIFSFIAVPSSQADSSSLSPIELPSLTPVDMTPVNINREQQLLRPGYTYYLFQNLPNRLWFNVSAETSQRYESNVFYSRTRYISDYVYRILPNVSLGYETFKKVSIYCNYFVIKDVFVGHHQLTFPTTQSLAGGLRRDFTISPLTNLQLDFQARELWQTTHLQQADLIPGMTLTRFVTPRLIVYANLLLQLRGANYFVAPTREIDPFYTLGGLYTKGSWMFTAVGTLVTNFRHPPFNDAIPNQSNNSIICDFEVSHPVPKLPNLVGFVRAEPIFNWNGNGVQGISGMDFRLFSGVRMTLSKPTYNASINNLKQQLKDLNVNQIDPSSGMLEPPARSEPHSKLTPAETHLEPATEIELDSATKTNSGPSGKSKDESSQNN